MNSFLSDRRVLATSAALITAAILAFLVGTYPSWRKAVGVDGPDLSALLPTTARTPEPDSAARATPSDGPATSTQDVAAPAAVASQARAKPDASTRPATASDGDRAGDHRMAALAVPDAGAAAPVSGPPSDQPGASGQGPTFDIVRVEPSGDSVIAGRGKPGADIVLLDQGKPIARATADASGQVAFVPPPLSPGEHSLMLSAGEPDNTGAISSQSVAVSVAPQGKSAPMVALITPGQATKLLSSPAAGGAAGLGTAAAASATPAVSVNSIDVEDQGGVYAAGKAAPNSHCRVYLNGSFVAAVTAGPDGSWSFKIKRGMRPGRYSVRVDQLQSSAGQVEARAEVPFDYPDRAAGGASLLRPKAAVRTAGAAGPQAAAPLPPASASASSTKAETAHAAPNASADSSASGPSPAKADVQTASADATAGTAYPGTDPTVVPQLLTTKVIRGDSLWRISRKMLGHGTRYTQIYAVNTTQIRDPKLIYPGQIFVMPQGVQ